MLIKNFNLKKIFAYFIVLTLVGMFFASFILQYRKLNLLSANDINYNDSKLVNILHVLEENIDVGFYANADVKPAETFEILENTTSKVI